jgi:hypothetical protein
MPSVPELDTSGSNEAAAGPPAATAAAAPAGTPLTTPLAPVDQQVSLQAAAALSAAAPTGQSNAGRSKSPSPIRDTGWGSGEAQALGGTGSIDSIERSAGSASGAAAAAGGTVAISSSSNGGEVVSCPLPLSTAEAVIAAAAAAQSAAAAAAAIAPVGLPVSGHAARGFPDLVLWPELLDIKADLARSRHTAVSAVPPGGGGE